MDVGHQPGELLGGGMVAREQDDAANERMAQDFPVLGRELEAGDIDHQWAQSHGKRSSLPEPPLRCPFEHRHGLHMCGVRKHIKYTGGA